MGKVKQCMLVLFCTPFLLLISVYGANGNTEEKGFSAHKTSAVQSKSYSLKNDIAFVSVWGSRPEAKKLQGFQRAVLFNARGEVVKKIDMGRDSVYSLDKMIQENKTRGPLFIRMYRR